MSKEYNFDEIIDRTQSNSFKYDLREKFFGAADILPMWVADMDFRTPDFVVEALRERVSHEIYGYPIHSNSLYAAIINWIDSRHQWKVKKEWIGYTPGVVPAFNMAVLAFTNIGDRIIIQSPVYPPFYYAAKDHDRQLVINPLLLRNGRYYMDYDRLLDQIDSATKMLILCSPHNPTGNVWKEEELRQLAEICIEKDILILSDEIHADIIYSGHKHIPLASISDEIAKHVITLMAASKTFNFAGLNTSYFIASNIKLFNMLQKTVDKLHLSMGNVFGNVATEAAYRYGESWLIQLISYLKKNITFAEEFINRYLPDVKIIEPEATFLLWVDFRKTGLSEHELKRIMVDKAQLGLSNGTVFGEEGAGFQRINIGCPKSILERALIQIQKALYTDV
jgi:cystathionine beta-lyase